MDTISERDEEDINIELILDNTKDVDLKFHVLSKALQTTNNVEDNISCLINYFRKSFFQCKNKTLLAKILIYLLEIEENQNEMPNILIQLGHENVNSLLFTEIFLQKDDNEASAILKTYLKYLSVDLQCKFFNSLFEFSKFHQNVKWINSIFHNIDTAALTHERSVIKTKDLWIYLTDYLINSQDYAATQIAISALLYCIDLVKNAKMELKFLSIDGNEIAWNAFFSLMKVFSFGCSELTKPSLELLAYVSSLHYFWRHCVFKLLLQHVPIHLKCSVMVAILQENIEAEYMRPFVKIILSEINKRNCSNENCPVFTELNHFSKNVNVASYAVILDELLNISWSYHHVWKILRTVLVDLKRNAVDLIYMSQITKFINSYNFCSFSYSDMEQLLLFFFDPENLKFWHEIKESGIPFETDKMSESKELKNIALPKILELSFQNSDDLRTISVFIDLLRENDFYVDMIRQYPLSIHVRMVIYSNLFNMCGYYIAENKLDRKIAVNDFYLYLKNHLNERTYRHYREMMVSFLDLMDRCMNFSYPEKACAELLNIIRYPELYTKYQIYCSTGIIRWVDDRFPDLYYDRNNQYYQLGQKWKSLILKTNDNEICKEGLYYVLYKGQLVDAEYNGIVKKLLEQHLCDQVTEEIYSQYLKVDLVNFAFTHLLDIIKKTPSAAGKFSMLFCEKIFSESYLTSDLIDLEDNCLTFCFSNEKNLEWSVTALYNTFTDILSPDAKLKEKVINIIIKIYLKKYCNAFTKLKCASTLLEMNQPYRPNNDHQTIIQLILMKTKEMYSENLKNDTQKLRIVQLLFLLIPFVTSKEVTRKVKKLLQRIVVGISVKESNSKNKVVRQISQYVYILLSEGHITIKEIQSLVDKIEEKHNLASLIAILYHVIPFYDFSIDEMEKLVSSLLSFLISSDLNLQMYTQVLLLRLYNTTKYKNILEKYESQLIKIDLEIESNKEKFLEALGTDYIFLKDLEPLRDNSLETILYILPKLNQVSTSEWEDIMIHIQSLRGSKIEIYNNKKDKDEMLNKAVNTYLDTNGKTKRYTVEEILGLFKLPSKKTSLQTG